MRKFFLPGLLVGAMLFFASSKETNAQIKNDRGTFIMPSGGDWLVETRAAINLNGGGLFNLNDGFLSNLNNGLNSGAVMLGSFSNNNYFPMLKLRKFSNNNCAHRILFNVSHSSQNNSDSFGDATNRNFGIALGYGMEKIYHPAERLNTYVGADLTVGFARISSDAALYEASQNAFGFGVRGFTGMDYYVLPKVYLGIELGYGISFNHYGEVEYLNFDNNRTSSNFSVTPYVTPTFRLGYVLCGGRKKHGHHEPTYRSRMRYDDDDE